MQHVSSRNEHAYNVKYNYYQATLTADMHCMHRWSMGIEANDLKP